MMFMFFSPQVPIKENAAAVFCFEAHFHFRLNLSFKPEHEKSMHRYTKTCPDVVAIA